MPLIKPGDKSKEEALKEKDVVDTLKEKIAKRKLEEKIQSRINNELSWFEDGLKCLDRCIRENIVTNNFPNFKEQLQQFYHIAGDIFATFGYYFSEEDIKNNADYYYSEEVKKNRKEITEIVRKKIYAEEAEGDDNKSADDGDLPY